MAVGLGRPHPGWLYYATERALRQVRVTAGTGEVAGIRAQPPADAVELFGRASGQLRRLVVTLMVAIIGAVLAIPRSAGSFYHL